MPRLLLASGSPRRRELLQLLGVPFQVIMPHIHEESVRCTDGARLASMLAEMKALSVKSQTDEDIIVGADTVVLLQGQILGKPADAASARNMLADLRRGGHQVITGLAVVRPHISTPLVQPINTRVWMRQYSDEEIARYIARGEPFDKAGAYAIQDPEFRPAERIQGCYANVMGLPLCHLSVILRRLHLSLTEPPREACEAHTGRSCPLADRILGSGSR
jgi:septum formation protein